MFQLPSNCVCALVTRGRRRNLEGAVVVFPRLLLSNVKAVSSCVTAVSKSRHIWELGPGSKCFHVVLLNRIEDCVFV